MTDALAEAARAVEEGSSADPDLTSDPDGRDSENLDRDSDPDLPDRGEQAEEPSHPLKRIQKPLQGSISEDRVGELWNPEKGGLNRLVLVLEETFGVGEGLPRIAHGAIALGEMAEEPPELLSDRAGGSAEQEAEAEQEAAPHDKGDTQEVLAQ